MSPNTTIHFHSSHMIPKTFMIEVNHYQIPSANNTPHTKPNNLTQTHTLRKFTYLLAFKGKPNTHQSK